jgi:small-conductance mechanosensitive channel
LDGSSAAVYGLRLGSGLRIENRCTRSNGVKALVALVVTFCLLAVAAIVAASTRRFEGRDVYLVAAAVVVGLAIAIAIALLP